MWSKLLNSCMENQKIRSDFGNFQEISVTSCTTIEPNFPDMYQFFSSAPVIPTHIGKEWRNNFSWNIPRKTSRRVCLRIWFK